jgi:hypothetical protein
MKKKSAGNAMAGMAIAAPMRYQEPKRVTVEKAKNGFVIEHSGPAGRSCTVAKNHAEMQKHMRKLMK